MLNFQTHVDDDSTEKPADETTEQTSGGEQAESMSLLGGVAGGSDFDGDTLGLDSGEKKRIPQSAIAIGAVVLIAGLALLGMEMMSKPAPADAATEQFVAEIDTAILKLQNPSALSEDDPLSPPNLRELSDNSAETIVRYDEDRKRVNVAVEEVKFNPFEFGEEEPELEPVKDNSAELAAKAEAERMAKLAAMDKKVQAMQLQSVMNGPNPVAVIDGEFLKVGAEIDGFTVTSIERLSVTLECDGQAFQLKVKR